MDLRSGLIGPTVDNIICKVEIFMKLTINDVVRLDVDVPEEGLFAGDIGTVVHAVSYTHLTLPTNREV